ncbi:MAG: Ig-like domain-containing protein [Actinomycetota bacterium]
MMGRLPARAAALALVAALALPPGIAGAAPPPEKVSPPGQITAVSVNAKQWAVLGLERFTALFELVRALRRRIPAFDGGGAGAVTAPDVVVVQEMRPSNLEIFKHLMRQRFSRQYEVFGPEDLQAGFVYNSATVAPQGEVVVWNDVCLPDTHQYPIAHFTEVATNQPFTVAGVHFSRNYPDRSTRGCLYQNVQALRLQLAGAVVPTILAGDFNKRPVTEQLECDPDERSEALPWWLALTAPADGGPAYADAVRVTNRAAGVSMVDEWTHERYGLSAGCDGFPRVRRGRIDYLFAGSALVAEAHADHPGWAGPEPGLKSEENFKYSDHRFVWGRFVISGPPQPAPPTAAPDAEGVIHLSWAPVEGAAGYVLYRAAGDNAYKQIAVVTSEVTTFDDVGGRHGVTYRYAVAATGADGAQGLESAAAVATADAEGPRVSFVVPRRDARGVDVDASIEVHFDERVAPESVGPGTVVLARVGGTAVAGRVEQIGRRVLELDPNRALRPGETYKATVRTVTDALGNRSAWFSWRFTTAPRRAR